MKSLLFILALLSPSLLLAQPVPDVEDYLMVSDVSNSRQGHFIFRSSRQVFYGYNLETLNAENTYKTSAKRIKELFDQADQIDFANLKSLPENEVIDKDADSYRIIEYRRNGKSYRIGWLVNNIDKTTKQLNDLVLAMDGFW